MAEITINGVKYTNVPNKKAGTKFAASLTQSNIGASQAVQDYVNSAYFYPLVNAIDINWNGVEVDDNSYINSTSDLITYIATKGSNVDLTSYATKNYVDQKIEDVIGGAPETLDTLKELADALADDASLAYVTQALDGKADKSSLTDYATNSYVTIELDKKANKTDIPVVPDISNYVTMTAYNMLVQRVDELAYLISYYHPATPTPEPTPTFEGYWTYNGMRTDSLTISTSDPIMTLSFVSNPTIASGIGTWNFYDNPSAGITINTMTGEMTIDPSKLDGGSVYSGVGYLYQNNGESTSFYITITVTSSGKQSAIGNWYDTNNVMTSNKAVVAGDTTTYTFTFQSNPISGWTFNDPMMTGITVSQASGNITIDPTNMSATSYSIYISANYMEDASYYMGSASFNINVLPAGSNPEFYYEQSNIELSNTMPSQSPMLRNSLASYDHTDYSSSDSNVATVNSYGTIEYVGLGTCTVTATAYDSSNNILATATISVTCSHYKSYPNCTWYDSNHMMLTSKAIAYGDNTSYTFTFGGTPSTGWTFTDTSDNRVTANELGDITIDPTQGSGTGQVTQFASYTEDSDYYQGGGSFRVIFLEQGADPQFYFEDPSIYLYTGQTKYPMIHCDYMYNTRTFTSSDSNVATVNSMGEIQYVGGGTCTITATIYDSNNVVISTATMSVECESPAPQKQYPVASWSGGTNMVTVLQNDSTTNSFSFTGTPLTGWSVDDPMISGITVGQDYSITISQVQSVGTFYVHISYPEDATYYSREESFIIHVIPEGGDLNFYFSNDSVSLDNNSMYTSNAQIFNNTGISAIDYPITWTSSDTSIATVAQSTMDIYQCIITYAGPGTCTITATMSDGNNTHTATIPVTCANIPPVHKEVPTFTWMDHNHNIVSEYVINLGGTGTEIFYYQAVPENGWTITGGNGTSIVLDTSMGTLTIDKSLLSMRSVEQIIASRDEDSSYYSNTSIFRITIIPANESTSFYSSAQYISLSPGYSSETINVINSTGIDTMQYPISYSSSDSSVATVDNYGAVTYVGNGNATITATLSDGNNTYTATAEVSCWS